MRLRDGLLVLAALAAWSCARAGEKTVAAGKSIALPVGDGVWFEDGSGPEDQDVEETLVRSGLATVFLPAAQLTRQQGHWEAQELAPPAHPFSRTRVFLVFRGDASVGQALGRTDAIGPLAQATWLAVAAALRDTRPFGALTGVHLDFPFSAPAAPGFAALVSQLKARMPRGMPVSVSLRFAPAPEEQEKMKPLAAACDGFVAFVFGEGNSADPIASDTLARHWWAGYAPSARGVRETATGEPGATLPEWVLSRLSDDPRVELLEHVSLKEESVESFDFRPRSTVVLDKDLSFTSRDLISFRQPLASDLIYHLGSDLAGRRFARGRIVALAGRSDAERLFPLTALSDVLLGKPALPDLHVSTETGRGFVAVSAENSAPHASVVSRTANWVEVQIPSAGIRDVQPGGFDRYEVYGRDRAPITLGLATAVRFFESLVQPHEKIAPARILVRRPLPRDCCATRFHLLAASGREVASDPAAR